MPLPLPVPLPETLPLADPLSCSAWIFSMAAWAGYDNQGYVFDMFPLPARPRLGVCTAAMRRKSLAINGYTLTGPMYCLQDGNCQKTLALNMYAVCLLDAFALNVILHMLCVRRVVAHAPELDIEQLGF